MKPITPAGWVFVLLSITSLATAQIAGSLRGTVTDPSGAVVQGARVVLANEATKSAREATSDAAGAYYFAAVEAGDYTLTVEFAGFRTREVRGIHMSPSDTRGVDVRLDLGPQTASIDVIAAPEVISVATGAREGLLSTAQIEALPMIGRNPLELIRTLPGVVPPGQNAMEVVGKTSGASATSGTTINGIRGANMAVSLDGARLQDIGSNNGTLIVPNSEAVSEVKILTGN